MNLVKMSYRLDKICRVCMKESKSTSIYSTEFAVMPLQMLMSCTKINIKKADGLPDKICYDCVCKLQSAYYFKEECENSDRRLRDYLDLPEDHFGFVDVAVNTDKPSKTWFEDSQSDEETRLVKKRKRKSRYKRIPQELQKKRGPKPTHKTPIICKLCNNKFKSHSQLQTHTRVHTGERPFGCSYCAKSFAQKNNLEIHERTHTGDRPFQCEVCSKCFSTPSNFRSHLKTHIGVRDFDCHKCGKGFYTAVDLERHIYKHDAIKKFNCEFCDKSFIRRSDLFTHKYKKHPLLDSNSEDEAAGLAIGSLVVFDDTSALCINYNCTECHKEFVSSESLNEHFRTHDANNLVLNTDKNLSERCKPVKETTTDTVKIDI